MTWSRRIQGVVAVDGPAGAGKSSAAEGLSRRLGAVRLDTGAIYRSLALQALGAGVSWDDGPALGDLARTLDLRFDGERDPQGVFLHGEDVTAAIRTLEISRGASAVSRHPEVRSALLGLQRRLGAQGLVVAEGRDVGTTVFPEALAKIFLTASPQERARRRHRELQALGGSATLPEVLAEQEARDRQDAQRESSPLRMAPDAVAIDSSALGFDGVVDALERVVREAALQAVRREVAAAQALVEERRAALPAHSPRPHQVLELEEAEERLDALRQTLGELEGSAYPGESSRGEEPGGARK